MTMIPTPNAIVLSLSPAIPSTRRLTPYVMVGAVMARAATSTVENAINHGAARNEVASQSPRIRRLRIDCLALRAGHIPLGLHAEHRRVRPVEVEQLLVGAVLDDLAVRQHTDPVRVADHGE